MGADKMDMDNSGTDIQDAGIQSMDKEKHTDTQSNKYQLTINNPSEYGLTHEAIRKILIENFKTLEFFCMADEKGSCHHTHLFACFTSRVRFSKIKKHFPTGHIEVARGSVSDNIAYIQKTGKWADSEKNSTQIQGTYEEVGNRPPDSRGHRRDMTELYNMIIDGSTNADILSQNQDYIMHIDKLDKVRTTILVDKYKNERRLDLDVTYIYGVTGSGKTRGVLDRFGDANVYRISTDYTHPFDGYACQPVICFDEFRDSLKLRDMLSYLDIYPIELPSRYSNKFACYHHVFIISNWEFERQYRDEQVNDTESYKAFLRRIHKIEFYAADGTVAHYNSVQEYLNRSAEFVNAPEQMELPFDR